MNAISIHFKQLGIRVGEKVFAYDPDSRTLGVRFKFKQLERSQGWLFKDVSINEWDIFCSNPESCSRLAYWFERGRIVSSAAKISFIGIWNCKDPQLPLPLQPFQMKLAA